MMNNIIILSIKSAGSTALQDYFITNYGFKRAPFIQHQEGETLYWTKVASLLELPQDRMHRSVVPFSKTSAKEQLAAFLDGNLSRTVEIKSAEDAIAVYHQLIKACTPNFIEKSPHHLYNRSNLELIISCYKALQQDVNFTLIGLVRHPHDVIYSAWKRWGYDCRQFELEWLQSYKNLKWLQSQVPVTIVKYEDVVLGAVDFRKVVKVDPISSEFKFVSRSVMKWKEDEAYGHQLLTESVNLASDFGYGEFENTYNPSKWLLHRIGNGAQKLVRKFDVRKIFK